MLDTSKWADVWAELGAYTDADLGADLGKYAKHWYSSVLAIKAVFKGWNNRGSKQVKPKQIKPKQIKPKQIKLYGCDAARSQHKQLVRLRPCSMGFSAWLAASLLFTATSIQPAMSASKGSGSLMAIMSIILDECVDLDTDDLCDVDEIRYFGDLDEDASGDEDGDGLSNGDELNIYQSDPTSSNTDGDGLSDYVEALIGTSLTTPASADAQVGSNSTADKNTLHKLNRLTFGPTNIELVQVRDSGGIDNWITEQLNPIGLPAAPPRDNSAVSPLYGGANDVYPLPYDCGSHVTPDPAQAKRDCYTLRRDDDADIVASIRPMHSTQQLQARMAMFWDNHFNTDRRGHSFPMQELYDEDNWFIHAFGNFKTLLMLNAKNYTMLEYLDLDDNQKYSPNENFPREIMELHSVGIDGGYTDKDIAELAFILTGWDHDDAPDHELDLCTNDADIISCGQYVSRYAYRDEANNDTAGTNLTGLAESARFDPLRIFEYHEFDHDDGSQDFNNDGELHTTKTLYEGTAHEIVISSLTGDAGEQEGIEAINFLAVHPSTASFICKKLAQEFISDAPLALTISNCATVFSANPDAGNQIGLVLANLLASVEFNAVATQRGKLKDTQEAMFSLGRLLGWDATHPNTSYYDAIASEIDEAEQPLLAKAEPTGYYETADNWLDTNIILQRFQEMNDMVFNRDGTHQSRSFVGYFNALGMTQSSEIMAHLFLLMYGGQYDEHDVQMGLNILHKVDPDNDASTALQAFDLNDTTDVLHYTLRSGGSPRNGLPDPEDRIRALIARLAASPQFQLH